jgi:hypothetical protein
MVPVRDSVPYTLVYGAPQQKQQRIRDSTVGKAAEPDKLRGQATSSLLLRADHGRRNGMGRGRAVRPYTFVVVRSRLHERALLNR